MKSFRELHKLMINKSIFPPSPLRLLRLACGKRCEICLNAIVKPCNNRVSHVRKDFGLFACWECVTCRQHSKRFKKKGNYFLQHENIYNTILDYHRTCNKTYGWRSILGGEEAEANARRRAGLQLIQVRTVQVLVMSTLDVERRFQVEDYYNYLWKKVRTDRMNERVGPILTLHDLPQIVESVRLKELAGIPVHTSIGQYFDVVLEAPKPNDPRYYEFIDAYQSTITSAEIHIKQLKWNKTCASADWKIKKLTNCMTLVKELRTMITHPQARQILVYKVNEWFMLNEKGYGDVPPLYFRDLWVRQLLMEHLIAPSKTTRRQMKKIAKIINKEYANHV